MRTKSNDQFLDIQKTMRSNLKRVRLKFNLKQWEVADGIKCTRGMYSSIENGNAKPSIERLLLIRDFYKIVFKETLSMDYLIGISDESTELVLPLSRSTNLNGLREDITHIKNAITILLKPNQTQI